MRISICLPIHKMKGREEFLKKTFEMLSKQTFKDFEVVITDNDSGRFDRFGLEVNYSFNPRKGMAQNTNAAIKRCKGELIKILYLDDHLADENSLQDIVDNFKDEDMWMITGTSTNPHPYYTGDIHKGNNKLGSPSALTFRNKEPMFFDEKMTWLLDCDYYKRMYDKYGEPKILDKVNVVMGIGDHQMTHILSDSQKKLEDDYMSNKYL